MRVDKIDSTALLKVCLQCARELKAVRKYGIEAYAAPDDQEEESTNTEA